MPVSASTVQYSYLGDGVTTTFAFPSRFLTAADLIVGVNGAQVLTGFSVTGAGADAGGNVVFSVAPANGATVTLIRAPAISQLLDFVNNQTVLAENIDNGLDKLTIVSQYLSYLLDRTLKLSQFDTGLTGNYDLLSKRLMNLGAPVDANDAARLVDLQSIVAGSGNVPSPTGGQIGFVLKAISAGVFGWIAAGNPLASDGSLAAPGYGFANETNTGFLRPSAGVLQAAILGVLRAELTASQFRTLVPLVQPLAAAVTAGTNAQGQGPLTNVLNVVTTTAANPSGVTLPTPAAGQTIRVINRGTNPINLYPATGGTVGALALNAPLSIPVGVAVDLFARTTTQWEGYASQPLDGALTSLAGLSLVAGDLLYATAADTLARLAVGTNGQYLTLVAGAPAWAAGPPLSQFFQSAEQAITNAGALTIAHGLSATPKLMQAVLVCKSAEFGYSVNDEVLINPHGFGDLTARGVAVVPDTTNLNVRYGANGLGILNKTTGTSNTPTNASWRLVLRAWA